MTHNSPTPTPFPGDDLSHIDADLRSLDAGVEMLAVADRAAPDARFEDRMMQATLGSLHGVEAIAARAAELGAMEQAAAPGDLEDGVFAESVPLLREGAETVDAPTLRHVGQAERAPREHARVVSRAWWANQYVRLAAAVTLVAGVGIVVLSSLSPGAPTVSPEDRLAANVSREMDLLFAVIDSRPASSDTSDAGAQNDPDELTKWLTEGAAS